MARSKTCLDPAHIGTPVTIVDKEVHICDTCGGERLSFKGGDPGLDDLMDPLAPKFTIWLDYRSEGWHPHECNTLAECFEAMRVACHSGDYRITRDVEVEIREKDPASA